MSNPNGLQDEKFNDLANFANKMAGQGLREPLQVVLIVMFVGVIAVGIWHGIAVQSQTDAIREATRMLEEKSKLMEDK